VLGAARKTMVFEPYMTGSGFFELLMAGC